MEETDVLSILPILNLNRVAIDHRRFLCSFSFLPFLFLSLFSLFFLAAHPGQPLRPPLLLLVPDAPERVKAVTSNEDAMVISWLPPRRPNGILTKYTVYIRVLDQGQEVKITKSSLTAQYLHHEATGLKLRESYEAWVTASTKMGQGPSTPVIKLQLSSTGKPTCVELYLPLSPEEETFFRFTAVPFGCFFLSSFSPPTSEELIRAARSIRRTIAAWNFWKIGPMNVEV